MKSSLIIICAAACLLSTSASALSADASDMQQANSIERRTSSAVTQLAFDVMRNELGKPEWSENSILSPLSMVSLLNLLYLGASGNARAQLARRLGYDSFNLTSLEPHQAIHNIVDDIVIDKSDTSNGKNHVSEVGTNFTVANLMLMVEPMHVSSSYQQHMNNYYDVRMETINKTTANEKELVGHINSWISQHTGGKINRLLEQVNLATLAFVLVNAAHFKGRWLNIFNAAQSREGIFYEHGMDQHAKSITFMNQKANFGYVDLAQLSAYDKKLSALDCEALLMPFAGHQDLSMLILLPHKRDGLSQLLRLLTPKHMDQIYSALEQDQVHVEMPKFKMDQQHDLRTILTKLGLNSIFAPSNSWTNSTSNDRGHFSEMFDVPKNATGVYVDQLLHKATVEVNEEGAEASAATLAVTLRGSARPAPTPHFVANHPFLFVIGHNRSNMPLFMGRFTRF